MPELFAKSFITLRKLWVLTLLTVVIHSIAGLQSLLDLQNLEVSALLMIPIILLTIYDFLIIKLVAEFDQKKPANSLAEIWKIYVRLLPTLFLKLIGAGLIFGLIMAGAAAFVQLLFGSHNTSLFNPDFVASLNAKFVFYNLLTTFIVSMLAFQSPLYFFAQEPFFKAFITSIKVSLNHLNFVSILTLITFAFNLLSILLKLQSPVILALMGALNGVITVYTANLILYYFNSRILHKKTS